MPLTQPFADRADAGRRLAERLAERPGLDPAGDHRPVVVLALPRGGVPVAAPVAAALHAPLDLLAVRKVGVPGRLELAMGAVASGGIRVRHARAIGRSGLDSDEVEAAFRRAEEELAERERRWRGERPPPDLTGRTVVLVDDGLATGSSMHAAVEAVRARHPAAVVVAVPVAPGVTLSDLRRVADDVVCLRVPSRFVAVSPHYLDFTQVGDEAVRCLLHPPNDGDDAESRSGPDGAPG